MFVRKIVVGILFLLPTLVLEGQIVKNGSLEGPAGVTTTPDDWFSCKPTSTVDVQPGLWGVTRQPQDGSTYINMVCRGNFNLNMNTCEELSQTLNQTLETGKCYRLDLYLSYFSNFAIPDFRNSIDLRISAGATDCSRDLELAYYTAVDHDDWRKYTTYFSPQQDLNSIWLEAEYSQLPTYFGHILIDNLSIEEVATPPARELVFCEGEQLTLSPFETENAHSFLWNTGADTPEITINEGGIYTVDISLGSCLITETFNVQEFSFEIPTPTDDFEVCATEVTILDVSVPEATDYLWQDGTRGPVYNATGPGMFEVLISTNECTLMYRFSLTLEDCAPLIEMPNAFTPNLDEKNDRFTPILVENVSSMRTIIYNRWGESVFETNDLMIQWDGTLDNGKPAPSATYYWRIFYTGLRGNTGDMKGTVTLIR